MLATRAYRAYWCQNGHPMHILLTTKRLRCLNPACAYFNIDYVLPTESVNLTAA